MYRAIFRLAALATLAAAFPQAAVASGDPVFGGKLFLQCRACHTTGAGERNGVGPNLNGVVGAKSGSRPGYVYSPAMAKAGLVWTPATLDKFLTRPSALVPGTKMAFAGVSAQKGRDDLIAYLSTFKAAKR
jgi:cytochrome c